MRYIKSALIVGLAMLSILILFFAISKNQQVCTSNYSFEVVGVGEKTDINIEVYLEERSIARFSVTDVPLIVDPVQETRCKLYIIRKFSTGVSNDPNRIRYELWEYNSEGVGISRLLLLHTNYAEQKQTYDLSISIEQTNNYLGLISRDLLSSELNNNDALVIKKLSDLDKDYLIIPLEEIYRTSNIMGSPTLLRWSKDSKNLWFELSEAAIVNGFGKINVVTKTFEIYKAPDGTMGGDAFNLESSWITYDPESFWCGEITCTNDERQDRIRRGMSSELYVYNLITKESILVESYKPDPLWYYKPRWISDSVLSYVLPDGTTKRYNVTKKQHVLE